MNLKCAKKIRQLCRKMGKNPAEALYDILTKQTTRGLKTKIVLMPTCGRHLYHDLKNSHYGRNIF